MAKIRSVKTANTEAQDLLESFITLRVFLRFGATSLFLTFKTSIGVDCSDVDAVFEGQMLTTHGNSSEVSAKRVSRDEKLHLSFFVVERFYHVTQAASHPNSVHAVVETLPQVRQAEMREILDAVVA